MYAQSQPVSVGDLGPTGAVGALTLSNRLSKVSFESVCFVACSFSLTLLRSRGLCSHLNCTSYQRSSSVPLGPWGRKRKREPPSFYLIMAGFIIVFLPTFLPTYLDDTSLTLGEIVDFISFPPFFFTFIGPHSCSLTSPFVDKTAQFAVLGAYTPMLQKLRSYFSHGHGQRYKYTWAVIISIQVYIRETKLGVLTVS